jgi:hypothetical protein
MRKLFWVILAGNLGSLAGCSEFVAPGERATAIDVVGEPTDPTTESMGKPDILGSAPWMADDSESLTDSMAEPLKPQPFPDEADDPVDGADEPDVNGGNGTAKPVSLKTKKLDSNSSE